MRAKVSIFVVLWIAGDKSEASCEKDVEEDFTLPFSCDRTANTHTHTANISKACWLSIRRCANEYQTSYRTIVQFYKYMYMNGCEARGNDKRDRERAKHNFYTVYDEKKNDCFLTFCKCRKHREWDKHYSNHHRAPTEMNVKACNCKCRALFPKPSYNMSIVTTQCYYVYVYSARVTRLSSIQQQQQQQNPTVAFIIIIIAVFCMVFWFCCCTEIVVWIE